MTHWKSGMRVTPARLGAEESGVATVSVASGATTGNKAFTFAEAFPSAPRMTATIVSGSGSAIRATVFVLTLSATGATVRIDLNAAAPSALTFDIHWSAEL